MESFLLLNVDSDCMVHCISGSTGQGKEDFPNHGLDLLHAHAVGEMGTLESPWAGRGKEKLPALVVGTFLLVCPSVAWVLLAVVSCPVSLGVLALPYWGEGSFNLTTSETSIGREGLFTSLS